MYFSYSSIFCLWTIFLLAFGTGVFHICFVSFCPVSCLPNVASVSWVSIRDCRVDFLFNLFFLCFVCPMLPVSLGCPLLIAPVVFSLVYLSCVLCAQCFHCLWIVYSLLSPSVVSNVYSSCIVCAQCCHCLSVVHSWFSLRVSLTFYNIGMMP